MPKEKPRKKETNGVVENLESYDLGSQIFCSPLIFSIFEPSFTPD